MAQQNVIAREQYYRIALETTFGVTPSGSYPEALTEIVPQHDALHIDGLAVEMLEVNDARARRNDATQPVQGLEIASKVAMTCYVKAVPSANVRLNDSFDAPTMMLLLPPVKETSVVFQTFAGD